MDRELYIERERERERANLPGRDPLGRRQHSKPAGFETFSLQISTLSLELKSSEDQIGLYLQFALGLITRVSIQRVQMATLVKSNGSLNLDFIRNSPISDRFDLIANGFNHLLMQSSRLKYSLTMDSS